MSTKSVAPTPRLAEAPAAADALQSGLHHWTRLDLLETPPDLSIPTRDDTDLPRALTKAEQAARLACLFYLGMQKDSEGDSGFQASDEAILLGVLQGSSALAEHASRLVWDARDAQRAADRKAGA